MNNKSEYQSKSKRERRTREGLKIERILNSRVKAETSLLLNVKKIAIDNLLKQYLIFIIS